MELVAQGVANIASPLLGGMPATGAIARTATNVKAGGRTPVAGIVHALTLLVITLFAGRWAALIPFATLAGILLLVCWRMGEWRVFVHEFRGPRSDVVVMVTTFLLTVLVDLTVAVGVGLTLAAVLFIKRMAEVTDVTAVTDELEEPGGAREAATETGAIYRRRVPPGMEVYEINGPFFFGAAARFRDTLGQVARRPQVLVIRMRNVPVIDATGLHALTELVRRCRDEGTRVVLSEMRAQPLAAIGRSGLRDELGAGNLVDSIDAALALAPPRDDDGRRSERAAAISGRSAGPSAGP
jgi:SulP family sulfate permease